MPKRSSKLQKDPNVLAASIVAKTTGKKNPAAVTLGRLGGLKGGKARAARLTPERRVAISRKAAKERWKKRT